MNTQAPMVHIKSSIQLKFVRRPDVKNQVIGKRMVAPIVSATIPIILLP